jgi:predicted Zn-dependent peptidase
MFYDPYAGFQVEHLANGLTVYIKEYANVSWFYGSVVVHAGAKEDPPGRAGLAHLVEHLVSDNVEGMTYAQLVKRLKTLGGYGWFGTTSYLASVYTFHVPADEAAIQEALRLYGQMLLQATIEHQIEEEKAIITREFARRYEHALAHSWALEGRPLLFEHHPRLSSFACVYGHPDAFTQSTQAELQAFATRYYVPANSSLVCIGAISVPDVLKMVDNSPFAWPKPGQRNRLPAAFAPPPPQTHERIIRRSAVSSLAWTDSTCSFEWILPPHVPGQRLRILCEMIETQMMEELRYKRQLTYDVSVTSAYYQDCSTVRISFKVPPERQGLAKDLLWQTLRSVHHRQDLFGEVKKERRDSIFRLDYSGDDVLEAVIGDLEQYHRLIPFVQELEQIEQTTLEQIEELAEYLTPERHVCCIQLP